MREFPVLFERGAVCLILVYRRHFCLEPTCFPIVGRARIALPGFFTYASVEGPAMNLHSELDPNEGTECPICTRGPTGVDCKAERSASNSRMAPVAWTTLSRASDDNLSISRTGYALVEVPRCEESG